jgi:hypothetical protein
MKNEMEISRYHLTTKETLASPLFVVSAKRPSPGRTLRYRNKCKNLEHQTKQNFESRDNRSARPQSRERERSKVSAAEHRKFYGGDNHVTLRHARKLGRNRKLATLDPGNTTACRSEPLRSVNKTVHK